MISHLDDLDDDLDDLDHDLDGLYWSIWSRWWDLDYLYRDLDYLDHDLSTRGVKYLPGMWQLLLKHVSAVHVCEEISLPLLTPCFS